MSIAAYVLQGVGPGSTIALYTTSGLTVSSVIPPLVPTGRSSTRTGRFTRIERNPVINPRQRR